MPIFNEIIITKTSDIAWDGGKPSENLIPNDGDVVFDPTGGGAQSTVILPYIEQHGEEADDGGFAVNWTSGDGSKGWDSVGVIAIIAPAEHEGRSVLEFSVENFPNNSPSLAPLEGFGIDHEHMGRSFDLVFPTQTAIREVSGLKIEHDVIDFSPDQAVNVIAIIAPADLNEVDVGHADLLFSESAPGGAGSSVYICGKNSPPASPEPVTHAGWGPWEVVLGGHSSSPANTGYANPSSFQIVSAGPSPPESDYSGAHALYQDVIIV
jgi:hypothetical protein